MDFNLADHLPSDALDIMGMLFSKGNVTKDFRLIRNSRGYSMTLHIYNPDDVTADWSPRNDIRISSPQKSPSTMSRNYNRRQTWLLNKDCDLPECISKDGCIQVTDKHHVGSCDNDEMSLDNVSNENVQTQTIDVRNENVPTQTQTTDVCNEHVHTQTIDVCSENAQTQTQTTDMCNEKVTIQTTVLCVGGEQDKKHAESSNGMGNLQSQDILRMKIPVKRKKISRVNQPFDTVVDAHRILKQSSNAAQSFKKNIQYKCRNVMFKKIVNDEYQGPNCVIGISDDLMISYNHDLHTFDHWILNATNTSDQLFQQNKQLMEKCPPIPKGSHSDIVKNMTSILEKLVIHHQEYVAAGPCYKQFT